DHGVERIAAVLLDQVVQLRLFPAPVNLDAGGLIPVGPADHPVVHLVGLTAAGAGARGAGLAADPAALTGLAPVGRGLVDALAHGANALQLHVERDGVRFVGDLLDDALEHEAQVAAEVVALCHAGLTPNSVTVSIVRNAA